MLVAIEGLLVVVTRDMDLRLVQGNLQSWPHGGNIKHLANINDDIDAEHGSASVLLSPLIIAWFRFSLLQAPNPYKHQLGPDQVVA